MKKTFKYFPDEKLYTLDKLEERINFSSLLHIDFETEADRDEIKARGLNHLEDKKVSAEAQVLGKQLIAKIEASYIPEVSVRWLGENLGHGLFAEETLEEGSYVGEYTGIVRRNDRRYFEPLNNYCYEYPVPDEIGRSFVIDATKGNLTRFINHSIHPNLKPTHVFHEGFYHLIFLALRRIEKGTQLSYDYGKNYWYIREKPVELEIL